LPDITRLWTLTSSADAVSYRSACPAPAGGICARRAFQRPVWANEPNGRPDPRFGQTNRTDNDAFRKRTQLPQTKPMDEIIVKTMFEHEQHDAGLFGRRARDTAQSVGQTNPTDRSIAIGRRTHRGGSVTHQPNEPQRTIIFPQTKPTSANEANGEIIVKTMFEHEQHDAWLLGRTKTRDTAQGTLATPSPRHLFWPNEPERQTILLFRRTNPRGRSASNFSQTNLCRWVRHGCS
jgi:hypothetical protein